MPHLFTKIPVIGREAMTHFKHHNGRKTIRYRNKNECMKFVVNSRLHEIGKKATQLYI